MFAQFSRAVRDVLIICYDRSIGRVGITVLPSRSPDFNSLDFTCGAHVHPLVFAAPDDNHEALRHLIVEACQTIHNYSDVSQWLRRSMMRRLETCIEFHG
jgi:hypothetical protein